MKEKMRATFKFNSGLGALICSNCSKIIKVGSDFTEEEKEAAWGDGCLEPQYCSQECKKEFLKNLINERLKGD